MITEMPSYRRHKVVKAVKISKLFPHDDGTVTLQPENEGYPPVLVGKEWAEEKGVDAGGYYVQCEDGYVSFSPAEVFEKGYRRFPGIVDATGDVRTLGKGLHHSTEVKDLDDPGQGNANHEYEVVLAENRNIILCNVHFQNGPIKEFGVIGVMNEDLIAIVIDRLEGFQSGKFACDLNERALYHLELSLKAMNERTNAREARGVEVTNVI